jgi:hypothetical protein
MRSWLAVLPALASLYMLAALDSSSPRASAVQFVDITEAAGIRFHHISAPEKKYIVESMSGGVALFDFDRDGCLDIYFTNSLTVDTASNPKSSRSALYRGHCDGTFTDVTERAGVGYPGWAMGVLAADFDGDGWQDLYVTCLGPNRLYRNNGDGTFTDVTARAGVDDIRWSAGAALGDMDNDGNQDLFVTNYVDFKLNDLPTFGQGKFCQYRGIPVQCGPRGLPGAGDSLFRNNGDGTFTDVTRKAGVSDPEGRYGLGVVWTDVDGDGWQDIYVANDSGPNFLYHNKRDGTFEEIGFLAGCAVGEDGNEQGSMGIAVGDYLHTGRFAFFVTNFADEYNALYRHDEPLLFTDVSFQSGVARVMGPWVGWGTAFFDYDNDGWLDLMAVNGHVYPQVDSIPVGSRYAQRILLFRNNGDGTFSEVAAQAGEALMVPRVSRGAAFGDIDNDGDIDVVINNLDGKPTVLRNEGGNRNHWINIRLRGEGRNPDALGARVKVVSGELVQWDEVRSGGSYISSSDLRLHFGLAHRERVDLLEVHWPGGTTERFRDIPANRFVTIEQGKGIARTEPARKQS